jgi:23S rRNA pseudouridine1911/1915/1917 synthase
MSLEKSVEEYTFEPASTDHGQRVDKYLVAEVSRHRPYSRTFLQKLIADGNVLVDGRRVAGHYVIKGGEKIVVSVPPPVLQDVPPENIPLKIVYEDDHLLVIDKPPGMSVHPGAGRRSGTLVNALLFYCKALSGVGGTLRPGIVHRLDKDTSGVLVVAKSNDVHYALAKQFENRSIKRKYVALVRGVVQADEGKVDAPIARDRLHRQKMGISYVSRRGAVTYYRVLKRFKNITLIELSLKTGRTHQIRVHMAHIGHPVVGDATYGVKAGMSRQALHAEMLGFYHPVKKQHMEFHSPIPEDMKKMIEKAT